MVPLTARKSGVCTPSCTAYALEDGVNYKAATSDCMQLTDSAHIHLKWVHGHEIGKLGSRSLRNNAHMEMSLHSAKCIMWCAINKQVLTGPIFMEGIIKISGTSPILIIQGAGHVDTTFLQQDVYAHITTNVIFNILHNVLGSHVLPNQFPEHFRCG